MKTEKMQGKKFLAVMVFDFAVAILNMFLYQSNGAWINLVFAIACAICALVMYHLWRSENYVELPDWAREYFDEDKAD